MQNTNQTSCTTSESSAATNIKSTGCCYKKITFKQLLQLISDDLYRYICRHQRLSSQQRYCRSAGESHRRQLRIEICKQQVLLIPFLSGYKTRNYAFQ